VRLSELARVTKQACAAEFEKLTGHTLHVRIADCDPCCDRYLVEAQADLPRYWRGVLQPRENPE
jgi:hypothetical protein